jgi:prepilin-type N-terminal cleavage/methylation domain-containing protein
MQTRARALHDKGDQGDRSMRSRAGYLRYGFTLVELLVVIAIVAVLLSILMPSLSKARVTAKRVRCAYNLKQIYTAVCLYAQAYDETYPCAQDPVATNPTVWLWMGRGWRRLVQPQLGGPVDANNPSVLFCPEDRVSKEKFESTSYAYSMCFYHSPDQIDSMTTAADTYKNPRPSVQRRTTQVARPSNKILIGEWQSNHTRIEGDDPGWWQWRGAHNFLFADGQVVFLDANDVRPGRDGNPNPCLTVHGVQGIDYSR